MLPEISLNILDIAQNSISAAASHIEIRIETDTIGRTLTASVADNGRGMTEDALLAVTDPFFTTRTTRRVGLGIPFFKQAAECTGGMFTIDSKSGSGTKVTAVFHTDHIDCMPLGDINATVLALITMNTAVEFYYEYRVNGTSFSLDTGEMREILGDVPLDEPEICAFLKKYLEENETEVNQRERITGV